MTELPYLVIVLSRDIKSSPVESLLEVLSSVVALPQENKSGMACCISYDGAA